MTSTHEDLGRARKVIRLALAIQRFALLNRKDCTPAEYARTLTPEAWKLIGRTIGINEPSAETIAATIAALYESESIGPQSALLLRNVMASRAAHGGERERASHGGPDGVPSDRLVMNQTLAPHVSESAHVSTAERAR